MKYCDRKDFQLIEACKAGYLEEVKLFVKEGVEYHHAIICAWAEYYGHDSVVNYLTMVEKMRELEI